MRDLAAASIRPVLRWPDPALAAVCAPVAAIDAALAALAADMLATMYAAPGRGLAAPQVGVLKRLFVMDPGWKEGAPDPLVLINPRLVAASGACETVEEGCLSIPGVLAPVSRPARVRIAWTDLEGAAQEAEFAGTAAVIVQHEIDHLDGIVTLDRLSGPDRVRALTAYAECGG